MTWPIAQSPLDLETAAAPKSRSRAAGEDAPSVSQESAGQERDEDHGFDPGGEEQYVHGQRAKDIPFSDEEDARYRASKEQGGGEVPRSLSPADLIARMRAEGPIVHQETGIAELDRLTRGGFIFGHRVVVTGAPGAGKTFVVNCAGASFLRAGLVVGVLAVDEDPDDVFARYVTMLAPPYHLRDCEEREPATLDAIEEAFAFVGDRLMLFDGGTTIEAAGELVATRAKTLGVRACLIVDSMQTAQCASVRADPKLSSTAAIEANVAAVRRVASAHRLVALSTSEMNRNAYRSRENADNAVALAAAKGSSSIEYSSQIVIALRSLPNEPEVIEVELAKNRGGEKGTFFLRLDRRSHALQPAERPDSASPGGGAATKFQTQANEVLAAIAGSPGAGVSKLRATLKAKGAGIGNDLLEDLLVHLVDTAQAHDRPEQKGAGGRVDHHYYAGPDGRGAAL